MSRRESKHPLVTSAMIDAGVAAYVAAADAGRTFRQSIRAAIEASADKMQRRLNAKHGKLPRDGDDFTLPLLVATQKALFCCCEDPQLEDARAVLARIDAMLPAKESR